MGLLHITFRSVTLHIIVRAGTIQSASIQTSTDTYRYDHHAVPIQMMVTAAKNNEYSGPKTIRFALDFHTIYKQEGPKGPRSLT